MDIYQKLGSLGLSERESRVYFFLLELGPTTTSRIIRKTGIASSKIYDVLEKLEHKGLVTHILKKGKKEFHPASPNKLNTLLKEKEEIISEILPGLEKLYLKTTEEVQAEVHTGKEGIKAIFEDILREGKEWYALGASGKAVLTLPYYMPHFYRRLEQKKINSKFLFVDSKNTRDQAKELSRFKNVRSKFLPTEIRNLMVIFIYSEKVVVIPITDTVEALPLAILIRSKESAESYKEYFNWIWKVCK